MNSLLGFSVRLIQRLFLGRLAYSSTAGLVAANIIPPAGILFLGWDLYLVISVYLIEFMALTFYISLHMLISRAEFFPGVHFQMIKKILFSAAVFLFVSVFIAPVLIVFLMQMSPAAHRYCIESGAGMMICYGLSFIRNAKEGRNYSFEYYLQLIGPRFMYFMAALGGGYALNMEFPSHSGILLLLPIAAAKTLMDYTYERSSYLKRFKEAYRIRDL
ncbi:MAG: DUF6498-containing protein [Spirochaetota bacterium]